jgi:hypothetical protein
MTVTGRSGLTWGPPLLAHAHIGQPLLGVAFMIDILANSPEFTQADCKRYSSILFNT